MAKYRDVDEYMSKLPDDRRDVMERLRAAIRAAAPGASETISYNMPAMRLDDRFLVSYEAYKRHYSLFPWSDAMVQELGEDLRPYAVGKGTIRFPANEPIPLELVKRVVAFRVSELSSDG
jgi:uncharacterized protein YdhG (YjbR/CyaY superfamily)